MQESSPKLTPKQKFFSVIVHLSRVGLVRVMIPVFAKIKGKLETTSRALLVRDFVVAVVVFSYNLSVFLMVDFHTVDVITRTALPLAANSLAAT